MDAADGHALLPSDLKDTRLPREGKDECEVLRTGLFGTESASRTQSDAFGAAHTSGFMETSVLRGQKWLLTR